MILIDTNVLLDIVHDDPAWADWSMEQLDAAALRDRLAINAVVYSELSISFKAIEELEGLLAEADIAVESIPREALFLAGKAFLAYRKRQGAKYSVLPDFYIGAHAAISGSPLLTRDAKRYQTYFPTVRLISPD